MIHPKSTALSGLFFAFLMLTACSGASTAEPTTEPAETTPTPSDETSEETSLEGTRVYGGGYSLTMPAGWVQSSGDDSILIYEETSQGLNSFSAVGFAYDGSASTDEKIAETRKITSNVYYEKYFKDDPVSTLLHEGLEFTSFGTTYTMILDSEVSDGTKVYPVGTEQWVFVDHSRILRFQGSWEKGNAEAENTVIDILFSVTVD